jgi:hypothetical protein
MRCPVPVILSRADKIIRRAATAGFRDENPEKYESQMNVRISTSLQWELLTGYGVKVRALRWLQERFTIDLDTVPMPL